MKKILFLMSALVILGAGCAPKTLQTPVATERTGSPLQHAVVQDGPAAIAVDSTTGRRFVSTLPPVFVDGNGRYTTQTDGEMIATQLSVGGTIAEDEQKFRALEDLESFETFDIGEWRVTTAYEKESGRHVARAAQQDGYDDRLYHVIECLGIKKSMQGFWDGCRTMIERAHVTQSTIDTAPIE